MTIKPFLVDGNIVVNEATITNDGTSIVLPSSSTIDGGGSVLDTTNSTTDNLAEGTTNLYFTDARADARIALQAGANLDLSSKSTTDLAEGTNLYYTDARADARIAAASITDLSDADQSVQTTDNVTFANITATGYIAGPATFTIDPAAVGDATGTVVILGDLQVDGTTTTINSTTLDVDDLNITVASGAANAAAADGAGLTVDGASATLTYDSANDRWAMNKSLDITGTLTSDGLTVESTGEAAALFKGYTSVTGVDSANNGEILLGNNASFQGRISYEGLTEGVLYIENSYNNNAADILFRSKSSGTAQNKLLIEGNGDISFYDGTGTTAKFFWDASAEMLTTSGLTVDGVVAVNANNINYTGSSPKINIYETDTTDVNTQLVQTGGDFIVRTISDDASSTDSRIRLDHATGDISFYDTSGNAKFFWDASAESLGIATTSPNANLEISDTIDATIRITSTDDKVTFTPDVDTYGTIEFYSNDTSGAGAGIRSAIRSYVANVAGGQSALAFTTSDGSSNDTEAMRIDRSGNVGIGTDNPSELLHTNGSIRLTTDVSTTRRLYALSGTGTYALNSSGGAAIAFHRDATNNDEIAFETHWQGNQHAERMRIDNQGNVGIGTSTPDTILEIVSSNPILTLRDTGSGFNNGDATLRLAESGPGDTLGGYFDVRLDASMLKFDFTPEGGSVSTYMAINSSDGNVGIGETSPAGKLEVQNTSVNYAILGTSNNGHYFESQSDDNTDGFEIYQQHGSTTTRNSFIVNDNRTGSKSAAFLVRGDGNVGINTSSPSFPLDIKKDGGAATLTARIYNEGTNAADDAALRIRIAGTTGSSTIFFGDGDSATVGRLFYDHNNDAMITYVNGSEVMRISSIGNLLVGTTTGTGQYNGTGSNGMAVNSAGQAGQYVTIQNETDSNLYLSKKTGYTDSRAINFAVAGSSVGTVTVSASATAYNTSSDYRLKENVVDLTGATSRLKQLEPKRFNFIADPDTTVDGFLAHEAQAVVPEAVTGTHNEVDDNGNAVMQGIDQSKLVPLLTAALQEAIAKIEALEARVTALES